MKITEVYLCCAHHVGISRPTILPNPWPPPYSCDWAPLMMPDPSQNSIHIQPLPDPAAISSERSPAHPRPACTASRNLYKLFVIGFWFFQFDFLILKRICSLYQRPPAAAGGADLLITVVSPILANAQHLPPPPSHAVSLWPSPRKDCVVASALLDTVSASMTNLPTPSREGSGVRVSTPSPPMACKQYPNWSNPPCFIDPTHPSLHGYPGLSEVAGN